MPHAECLKGDTLSQKKKAAAQAAGAGSVNSSASTVAGRRVEEIRDSEIAARAYSYWEERQSQGGSPEEDWYRAESELTRERNG
jgi:hypothetical protein